jgi:hypothetical protein
MSQVGGVGVCQATESGERDSVYMSHVGGSAGGGYRRGYPANCLAVVWVQ